MFDDIDKVIPKMDENDKEKIYRKLTEKKKKKNYNNKMILAFASVFILALIIIPVFVFAGIKNKPANTNQNTNQTIVENGNSHIVQLDEKNLAGMAAYSEFKNNSNNLKKRFNKSFDDTIPQDSNENFSSTSIVTGETGNNNTNTTSNDTNKDYLKVSYPYDYIKIKTAYKFTIEVNKIENELANEIIESSCGLGKLEVVVAEFDTYVDENGNLHGSASDTMISLRGYNGYYTILLNGGSYEYNDDGVRIKSEYRFSSHKKITNDGVEKDFTPPILTIVLVEENDTESVYFEASMTKMGAFFDKKFAFDNIDEVQKVSRDTLYSVMELSKLETVEVTAKVIEIDYDYRYITVETNANLNFVNIIDITEGINIDDIKIDDLIIVEYDKMFDGYDPVVVNANRLSIKTKAEDVVETDNIVETENIVENEQE